MIFSERTSGDLCSEKFSISCRKNLLFGGEIILQGFALCRLNSGGKNTNCLHNRREVSVSKHYPSDKFADDARPLTIDQGSPPSIWGFFQGVATKSKTVCSHVSSTRRKKILLSDVQKQKQRPYLKFRALAISCKRSMQKPVYETVPLSSVLCTNGSHWKETQAPSK